MNLCLRQNNFEGPIPESFGNLISLEALDLANNNLSGTIPKSLERLKYLTYLNLSFKKLQVPTEGVFVNFSSQTFSGNDELCGSPLLQLTPCKISSHGRSKTTTKKVLLYILPAMILIIVVILVSLRCQRATSMDRKALFQQKEICIALEPTDDMFGGRLSLKEYIKGALPDAVVEIADANLLKGEENFADKKDCLSFIWAGCGMLCEVPHESIGITQVLYTLISIRTQFLAGLPRT
ncbi:hypothetical protein GH714_027474 [Hevea brasiliensis]|uniref:Leucine-rich repeat-containing N-terminal plant-type domain-containing protein n=1 Tax=Hevea brasiliensis TaxID=3981 RepID=A0A6A6MMQ6_HEVBR|nr:hypothetical protein GH714_027474 [Hevea brasiliensis]